MKKFASSLFAAFTALLLVTACQGRKEQSTSTTAATQTIAPAAAQPAPTGTEAMTQTVDVEDNRSEEDGGVMTSRQEATPPSATATSATATSATPKTSSAPTPKAKKPKR